MNPFFCGMTICKDFAIYFLQMDVQEQLYPQYLFDSASVCHYLRHSLHLCFYRRWHFRSQRAMWLGNIIGRQDTGKQVPSRPADLAAWWPVDRACVCQRTCNSADLIFVVTAQTTKIGSLENFQLQGNVYAKIINSTFTGWDNGHVHVHAHTV